MQPCQHLDSSIVKAEKQLNHLCLDLWPRKPWNNKWVFFKATTFKVLYCNSNRKQIHTRDFRETSVFVVFPGGSLQLPGHCSWRLPQVTVLTWWPHRKGDTWKTLPPLHCGSVQRELDCHLCIINIFHRQLACHNEEEWWRLGWITDVNVRQSWVESKNLNCLFSPFP